MHKARQMFCHFCLGGVGECCLLPFVFIARMLKGIKDRQIKKKAEMKGKRENFVNPEAVLPQICMDFQAMYLW